MVSLFSIRPLAMLAVGELEYYRWIYIGGVVDITLTIAAIGVTAYFIGYYVIPMRLSRLQINYRGHEIRKSRLFTICFFYVAAGIILAAVYVGSNPIGTLVVLSMGRSENALDVITVHSEYLFSAPVLISCAVTLIIAAKGNNRFKNHTIFALLLLILIPVAWFYLFGVRRFIIPSAFIPLAVFLLARRVKFNLNHFVFLLPVLMMLAALPFMRTEGARSEIGGFADQAVFALSNRDVLRKIFLGSDTEMFPALAVEIMVLDAPSDFYYGAATIGDLLIAPIPSALFEKPMSARDRLLVDTFGEPCSALPGRLCPDFSVIGTFYQDFWLPGVFFGMLLMGYVGRRVWFVYNCTPGDPYSVFNVAAVSIFTFIIIRAGFMPAFQWFLYFWIPVTLGLHMIVQRRVE